MNSTRCKNCVTQFNMCKNNLCIVFQAPEGPEGPKISMGSVRIRHIYKLLVDCILRFFQQTVRLGEIHLNTVTSEGL